MDIITYEEYHKEKEIGDIWVNQTKKVEYILIAKDPDHWAAYKWEYIAHPELDIKKEA